MPRIGRQHITEAQAWSAPGLSLAIGSSSLFCGGSMLAPTHSLTHPLAHSLTSFPTQARTHLPYTLSSIRLGTWMPLQLRHTSSVKKASGGGEGESEHCLLPRTAVTRSVARIAGKTWRSHSSQQDCPAMRCSWLRLSNGRAVATRVGASLFKAPYIRSSRGLGCPWSCTEAPRRGGSTGKV